MVSSQTSQMVAWLDEERRKDKAVITKLEERSASQSALIEDQSRRIYAMENELASLKAAMLTTGSFNETMSRLRSEVTAAVEQAEARRSVAFQDLKKMRDIDREAINKALEDFQNDISVRIERELQPRRAEEERLARVALELQAYADNLTKGLEEFERSLAFLEEQRRQDSRRISDMSGELLDLSRRHETQQAKLELLEDLVRRNERGIADLSGTLIEFKQQRQEWLEQEALASQRRDQVMNDMVRRMEGFAGDMDNYGRQFAQFSETHRAMKKELEDFNRLADRIDRRLNEVAELQRLSEDRFRQGWDEFLQEDQKRWRQFTLTNDESWRENERTVAGLSAQVGSLLERSDHVIGHLKQLRNLQYDYLRLATESFQNVRERAEDEAKTLPPLT